MKQNISFLAFVLLCFGITVYGFTSNQTLHKSTSSKNLIADKMDNNSKENVAIVFPNPESGILNLHCPTNLIPPISVKAFNQKDNLVKHIHALIPEGSNKNRFIQFNTTGLEKGAYKIILYDVNGKTAERKILIEK
ncbi:MAG: hypothetical protein WCP65_02100 [Bacteroidota bacterium]